MNAAIQTADITDDDKLAQLIRNRVAAKRKEDIAIGERRKIDEQIVALMRDPEKDEGTINRAVDGFKASVTFSIDRKADTGALRDAWASLPDAVKAAFRWKVEVETKEFKALSGSDKDRAAAFVESKPKSPSVKIELA